MKIKVGVPDVRKQITPRHTVGIKLKSLYYDMAFSIKKHTNAFQQGFWILYLVFE